jgi:hypothetical protein
VEDGGRRRAARAREQEARLLVGWEKKVWPPVRPPDLSHAVGLTAAGLEERRWHGDLGRLKDRNGEPERGGGVNGSR